MKELRSDIPEPLTSLAEALKKAAERTPNPSSSLTSEILGKAESLRAITGQTDEGPSRFFGQTSQDENLQTGLEEEQTGQLEEDIDTKMFLEDGKRKPAVPQAQQEISQRQAKSPNKSARIQAKASLRQLSAAISQKSVAIAEPKPAENQEEQTTESIELTPEQQKEERRKIAKAQRTANIARKAAEKENEKEIKMLSDETKQEYNRIGRDFFYLYFTPLSVSSINTKLAEFKKNWQELFDKFPTYTQSQQTELVRQMSLGLDISDRKTNPIYLKQFGSKNDQDKKLEDYDYLVHMMSLFLSIEGQDRVPFVNYVETHLPGGKQHITIPAVQRAIASWLGEQSAGHSNSK